MVKDIDKCLSWSSTSWIIWKSRNREVLEGVYTTTHVQVSKVCQFIDDYKQAFMAEKASPFAREPRLRNWKPRPEGFWKLNKDGSSFGNPGRAGYDGLIRDNMGTWIVGFAGYIGSATNVVAELWAIRQGVQLALARGCSSLVIETDSMDA